MLRRVIVRQATGNDRPYKLTDKGGRFLLTKPSSSRERQLKCRPVEEEMLLSSGTHQPTYRSLGHASSLKQTAARLIDPCVRRKKIANLPASGLGNRLFAAPANAWRALNIRRRVR